MTEKFKAIKKELRKGKTGEILKWLDTKNYSYNHFKSENGYDIIEVHEVAFFIECNQTNKKGKFQAFKIVEIG